VDLSVEIATDADAASIAALRTRAADRLTLEYGRGAWSWGATEAGVVHEISISQVLIARADGAIAGTLRLATRKPWAIDAAYFVPVQRPLYLMDMAVDPEVQRRGVGRFLLEQAAVTARAWPADAIRLDAYDAPAGAGPFYIKCGYRDVGHVVYRGVPHIYFERLLGE
jgi:GNAT superfamily N-acetyltransferase